MLSKTPTASIHTALQSMYFPTVGSITSKTILSKLRGFDRIHLWQRNHQSRYTFMDYIHELMKEMHNCLINKIIKKSNVWMIGI